MKKTCTWILILAFAGSLLSACGRKETVSYQGDTASTSDATDDPIRNLDYTVPGDKGSLTVQAQVDTSLAEKSAPVASLSRADFTDEDIQMYADLIFDKGSYSLFMPYEFRSTEDLSAVCDAWEDTFKSYESAAAIPEYMIAAYYDATNVLATKKQDTDAANHVVETDGDIKWYNNPYNEADEISYYAHQFCILEGTVQGIHYYLCFFESLSYCRMELYRDYGTGDMDFLHFSQEAQPIYASYAESNGGNACAYSSQEAQHIAEDCLQKLKLSDYTVQNTFDASRNRSHYTMDASLIVEEPQTESATDSYVIYANRSLNGLSPIYSYETFQTELTDYSNTDYTTDGKLLTFTPDETNTFYGYESLTANVDSDGLSYLIWNNPMQVDTIETAVSPTLSFDQIDTIARNYIDSRSVSSPYPDTQTATESASTENEFPPVTQIRYGMIRISDPEHSTYLFTPAWYYIAEPQQKLYYHTNIYVIINAIDGSIYNPWLGTLEPADNNLTKK